MERTLILALLLSSVLFALFLFVQARLFPPEPLPSRRFGWYVRFMGALLLSVEKPIQSTDRPS